MRKHSSMSSGKRMFSGILFLGILMVFPIGILCAQGSEHIIISKGDQLLVTVWGYGEFTTTQTVKDNGMFTMPLIGEMKAAGLTKEEFIISLQKKLAEYIPGEIKITLSVLSSVGQRVTVLGAVTRPDNYAVSSEMNLLEAMRLGLGGETSAGGLPIDSVDSEGWLKVDLEDYIDRSDIENLPKVRAGDIVFVPRQQNVVREFGEFFRDVALLLTLFRITEGVP